MRSFGKNLVWSKVIRRAVTFSALLGCGAFALLYWQESELNVILNAQLVAAKKSDSVTSEVVDENSNFGSKESREQLGEAELIKKNNHNFDLSGMDRIGDLTVTSRDKSNRALKRDFADWSSEQHIKEIETHIHLEPEQRQIVVEALKGSFASDHSPASPERLAKILEDAGLRNQAALYLQGAVQQQAIELEKEIDDQVVLLSNRLGLSDLQKDQIREALFQVEVELKPLALQHSQKIAEVMMGHFRGAELHGQKDLANSYQQLSEAEDALNNRREVLLRERLSGVLNSGQFSKWSGELARFRRP